ncbi:MAG TPA: ATP-binding protein [Polyangiaceae bacterium]|jgi:predicted ATPase
MSHRARIVLTGGPGAGKTAVLELARRHLRGRIQILHEAASIVFIGGFPRHPEVYARAAAQRAIFHVQSELERWALDAPAERTIVCDRGTVDGLAYWPGPAADFFAQVGTTHADELARYDAVVHLRTPARGSGYHKDAVRNEDAALAETIDARLLEAWGAHPKRFLVESATSFMDKAHRALAILDELVGA